MALGGFWLLQPKGAGAVEIGGSHAASVPSAQEAWLYGSDALLGLLALGLGIAFAVIKLTMRLWSLRRGVDHPDGHRKRQSVPVLRVGGLAFYAVFLLACLAALGLLGSGEIGGVSLWSFFLLGSALFWLGFADDLCGIPAMAKLLVQILVGTGAYLSGMSIDIVTNPIGQHSVDTGGFALLLTILWFIAIPNLFNLIDGMDGLAGGLGLFLAILLAAMAYSMGNAPILLVSVMMLGGFLAFLRFNFPPARIYMGDGGAYLIGYFVASVALIASQKGTVSSVILAVVVALGFPILDTSLAVIRRGLSGVPLMAPDALHLHHRLQAIGLSKRKLLFATYGVFAALSALSFAVFFSPAYALPIVGGVMLVVFPVVLRRLQLPHNLKKIKDCLSGMLATRRHVRYAYAISQVLAHDLEWAEDPSHFWGELKAALNKLNLRGRAPLDAGPGSPGGGESRLLNHNLSDSLVWALHCPSSLSQHQWRRITRCFYPVVLGAIAKWGGVPDELGIRSRAVPAPETPDSLSAQTIHEARLGYGFPR